MTLQTEGFERPSSAQPKPDPNENEFDGYHSFHAEPRVAGEEPEEYGSFEVFWHPGGAYDAGQPDAEGDDMEAGWYWWACFPGCIPDGDPEGPFTTSLEALQDADEYHPEA